ncbi:hypothetical protein [Paraglaciecola arctica]|uniref:hypothetical protein n=1 Tax=Paraglaciecola arctica TaxID=1128911 RepID=UPI001C07A7A3|nr:hypothetical protein [Paraglaciecola arctica]MBU3005575.1 hypothetical protein [Paraglaciecola arctica]
MKSTMVKKLFFVSAILLCCSKAFAEPVNKQFDKSYASLIDANLAFFIKHGWDKDLGVFYSELDNQGKRVSEKIHTVALGRLIYALAYASQYNQEYLSVAKRAASFQLDNLIANETGVGHYFLPTYESGKVAHVKSLDIWQQTYGMTGLVELYRQTQDEKLLAKIHELHKSYVKRFQDPLEQGFVMNYDLEHSVRFKEKSFQSVIYPLSGYLINLWEADREHRDLYEQVLQDHASLAAKYLWSEQLGWPNISFSKNWKPCVVQDGAQCPDV